MWCVTRKGFYLCNYGNSKNVGSIHMKQNWSNVQHLLCRQKWNKDQLLFPNVMTVKKKRTYVMLVSWEHQMMTDNIWQVSVWKLLSKPVFPQTDTGPRPNWDYHLLECREHSLNSDWGKEVCMAPSMLCSPVHFAEKQPQSLFLIYSVQTWWRTRYTKTIKLVLVSIQENNSVLHIHCKYRSWTDEPCFG